VELDAFFYQGLDCTGQLGSDGFGAALSPNEGWQELTGVLVAPTGTQSALFRLGGVTSYLCSDYCWAGAASFDQVYVEGEAVPAPPQTWITSGPPAVDQRCVGDLRVLRLGAFDLRVQPRRGAVRGLHLTDLVYRTRGRAPCLPRPRDQYDERHRWVDLSWNGPSRASFDVYRNGLRVATIQATSYTDNFGPKSHGTYTYKVCAPAISSCSNQTTASF
jgi:hypothetical protein